MTSEGGRLTRAGDLRSSVSKIFRRLFGRSEPTPFAAAWVEVKNQVAFVFAQSGFRGVAADHDAYSIHIAFPPGGLELGAAVRAALVASRRLDPKKLGIAAVEKFMFEEAQERHRSFLCDAQRLTGAKTEAEYASGLKACSLLQLGDRIQIVPALDGHGGWGEYQAKESDKRFFSVDASDEIIQASVLEALSLSR